MYNVTTKQYNLSHTHFHAEMISHIAKIKFPLTLEPNNFGIGEQKRLSCLSFGRGALCSMTNTN